MTFKENLANKLSDLKDDLHFLKRKDVSWRFKILNLLSGDRLRFNLMCLSLDLNRTSEHLNTVDRNISIIDEPIAENGIKVLQKDLKRLDSDINDIWKL